jgi:hypothetical protein
MEEWLTSWTPEILRHLLRRKGSVFSGDLGRPALGVTRREFLVGVGVTTASSAAAAQEPMFFSDAGTLRIQYLGAEWLIAPKIFGPNALIQHIPQPSVSSHTVLLQNARFPGLDLNASFEAHIYPRAPNWWIMIRWPALGLWREIELGSWIKGLVDYQGDWASWKGFSIGVGGCQIRPASAEGQIRVNHAFAVEFSAAGGIQFRAQDISVTADQTKIRVDAQPKIPGPVASAVAFSNIEMGRGRFLYPNIRLGSLGASNTSSQTIELNADGVSDILLSAYQETRTRRDDAKLVLRGEGAVGIQFAIATATPFYPRIQVEPWILSGFVNDWKRRRRFSAELRNKDQGVETNCFAVVIGPETTEGADKHFTSFDIVDGRLAHIVGAGDTFAKSINFRGLLVQAHVPVKGATGAEITFRETPVEIVIGADPGPRANAPICGARIHIGTADSSLDCALETGMLKLDRTRDAFGLRFRFLHYALSVRGGRTKLIQRWDMPSCNLSSVRGLDSKNPHVIVEFPPQHEQEEVFNRPKRSSDQPLPETKRNEKPVEPANSAPLTTPAACRRVDNGLSDAKLLRRDIKDATLARTKLAGGSRIVFKDTKADITKQTPPNAVISVVDLSIEQLTEWEEFTLAVSERALGRREGLERQLQVAGIDKTMDRATARDRVRAAVHHDFPDSALGDFADNWGVADEISAGKTSIEAIYRLLVSPDKDAKFDTPRRAPRRSATPLMWSATLRQTRDTAVRAIWARGMNLGFLETGKPSPAPITENFATSLNDNDRRELVAMSSIFGLAALRRLVGPTKAQPDGRTPAPTDDPNGMVFLPTEKFLYLDPSETGGVQQEGVVRAKPFDRFELRLGRFSNVNAFWQGEPPAGVYESGDPFFRPAFTVERYTHRIGQGRDTFVEVIYKGFLFPIGHRAALLKVSYLDFFPFQDKDFGNPTAYLLQEDFIVCRKPTKAFPAYGQPYDSRDFPAKSIRLITTETGSLQQPKPINTPAAACESPMFGTVFWPRLREDPKNTSRRHSPAANMQDEAPGQLVSFDMEIDGSLNIVKAPLIFFDNAAAHDPDTVGLYLGKYKALSRALISKRVDDAKTLAKELGLEEAEHDRATLMVHVPSKRRYGEEKTRGDLSYQTTAWRLGARGRIPKEGKSSPFVMDGFMEGQDQPPFYPVVEAAEIRVEQIERLTGTQSTPITAAFNPIYVENGFDPRQNPSEMVLDILLPQVQMATDQSGGATGALASGNMLLAGLSRKIGPVGGRALTQSTNPAMRGLAPAATDDTPKRTMDASSALSGKFSAKEFFGGALKEAVLLGVVSLGDIVVEQIAERAPQIKETVDYGINAAGELLKKIQDGIEELRGELAAARASIDAGVAALGMPNATLKDFYPELDAALGNVDKAADDLVSALNGPNVSVIGKAATKAKEAAEALIHQLEKIADDPVPTVVKETLAKLRNAWDTLRQSFTGDALKNALADYINKLLTGEPNAPIEEMCAAVIQDGAFQAFFGFVDVEAGSNDVEAQKRLCRLLMTSPADVAPRLQYALFREVLTDPLLKAIETAKGVRSEIDQKIQLARREIVTRICTALRAGKSSLDNTLFEEPASIITDAVILECETIPLGELLTPTTLTRITTKAKAAFQDQKEKIRKSLAQRVEVSEKARSEAKSRLKALLEPLPTKLTPELTPAQQLQFDLLMVEIATFEKRKSDAELVLGLFSGRSPSEELAKIEDTITAAITDELNAAKSRTEQALKDAAKAGVESFSQRLVAFLEAQLHAVEALAKLNALIVSLKAREGDLALFKTQVADTVEAICLSLFGDATVFQEKLAQAATDIQAVTNAIERADLPPEARSAQARVAAAVATLAKTRDRISTILADYLAVRETLLCVVLHLKGNAPSCGKPPYDLPALLEPVARITDARRKILLAVGTGLSDAQAAMDAVGSLADSTALRAGATNRHAFTESGDIRKLSDTLLSCARQFLDIADDALLGGIADADYRWKAAQEAITKLGVDVGKTLSEVRERATELHKRIADLRTVNDPAELWRKTPDLFKEAVAFTIGADKQFVGDVMQVCLIGGKLAARIKEIAEKAAETVLAFYKPVNAKAYEVVSAITALTQPGSSDSDAIKALRMVVATSAIDELTVATGALAEDKAEIDRLNAAGVAALLKLWKDKKRKAGLLVALDAVRHIVEPVFQGNLSGLFDVRKLKQALLDAIADMVPHNIDLAYDFDAELDAYPESDPIFEMDEARYGADDYEEKIDEKFPKNDLVIETRVKYDLLNPGQNGKPDARVKGFLRPFKIHILGDRLDLVTLRFKGARFAVSPGEKPTFKADVGGYEIGKLLTFLSALGPVGQPKSENGPYYFLEYLPPQVSVGYTYTKHAIQLGTLQLLNLHIDVGADLPLDGRQAIFHFEFAKRTLPFMIAQPPYGGGGYLALRANAKGVIGFAVQLEFGAVVGFEMGPLTGFGCITAGFYFESDVGRRVLEGFVHAIGEANLACFGLSVNMEIKVRQQDNAGGDMEGSATFSYSFKVSIVEVRFTVVAGHKQKGSGGQGSHAAAAHFYADNEIELLSETFMPADGVDLPLRGDEVLKQKQFFVGPTIRRGKKRVRLRKEHHWSEYRKYMDI